MSVDRALDHHSLCRWGRSSIHNVQDVLSRLCVQERTSTPQSKICRKVLRGASDLTSQRQLRNQGGIACFCPNQHLMEKTFAPLIVKKESVRQHIRERSESASVSLWKTSESRVQDPAANRQTVEGEASKEEMIYGIREISKF